MPGIGAGAEQRKRVTVLHDGLRRAGEMSRDGGTWEADLSRVHRRA